jgi:hypothetical protein
MFTYSSNNCVTTTSASTATNTYTFSVSPGATTTYKLCSLSDALCTSVPADYNGTSATVTVLTGAAGLWTGNAGDNDWFNCLNWANGYVPTIATNVTIPTATPQCRINAAGAVCASLTVSGSSLSFINASAYLTDAGNVTISGTGSITMAGGGTLEVRGSWNNSVNAAAFTSAVGKVIFSGSTSPASITATAGIETFYDLQLKKTNRTDRVHLKSSIVASHDLRLDTGIFVTETNLFTWNNSGGALTLPKYAWTLNDSLVYNQSFIATCDAAGTPINVAGASNPFTGGAGFQIKNVGASDTYFPVGASYLKAGNSPSITKPAPNRMMINNTTGALDFTVVVNYGDIGYTNGLGGAWRVNRIWYLKSSAPTGKAVMQLYYTKRDETLWAVGENEVEAGFLYDIPALIQKDYDTTGSRSSFLNLSDPPDYVNGLAAANNTELYAQYTFASNSLTNGIQQFQRFSVVNKGDIVLPVTITSVKAWQDGAVVRVGWTSQQEINIDHYEVERALDAQHFTSLGSVAAKNTGLKFRLSAH